MKIKVSAISNREHNIKTTNKVMRNTLKYQLSLAESEDGADKTVPERLRMSLDAINNTEQYLIDTLGLNKSEQEKLDEKTFNETLAIANYVTLRIQGMSDEDIDLANKKEQAADKSQEA